MVIPPSPIDRASRFESLTSLPRTAETQPSRGPGAPGFSDIFQETYHEWRHEGGKIGKLAGASALGLIIPLQLAAHLPAFAGLASHPLAVFGAITLACIEEETLGLGRRAGEAAGAVLGAGAGVAQATYRRYHPNRTKVKAPVQLPFRAPTGAPPRERLIPAAVHRLQRALLGRIPPRSRMTDMTEVLGMNLMIQSGSVVIPAAIASLVGGPTALVMNSLAGTIVGMVVTGVLENRLGLGRALGELAGQAFTKIQSHLPASRSDKPDAVSSLMQSRVGRFARSAVDRTNQILAEPLEGVLLDTALLTNRLFAESPVQSMHFEERTLPTVDRNRVVDVFSRLAQLSDEEEVAHMLTGHLDDLRIPWERKADGTIVATVPGHVEDAPTVVLSAPLDHAHSEGFQRTLMRRRKASADEDGHHRAGLAQILEAVYSVLDEEERKHPEIKMVFTARVTDGKPALSPEDISRRPAVGFVVDCTSLREVNLTDETVVIDSNAVKYNYSQEEPVVQVAMRAMAQAGMKPRPIRALALTGAGTVSNTPAFNSKHIRSIVVGNGMTDVHAGLRASYIEQGARHLVGIIKHSADLKLEGETVVPRHVTP